jgi:hypothetical protein
MNDSNTSTTRFIGDYTTGVAGDVAGQAFNKYSPPTIARGAPIVGPAFGTAIKSLDGAYDFRDFSGDAAGLLAGVAAAAIMVGSAPVNRSRCNLSCRYYCFNSW